MLVAGAAAVFAVDLSDTARAQTFSDATNTVTIAADDLGVSEGGLTSFTLTRWHGGVAERHVRVKTWEPHHEDALGQNETEHTHQVTFAVNSRVATFTVGAFVDPDVNAGTLELKAQVLPSNDRYQSLGNYVVGSPGIASVPVSDVQQAPAGFSRVTISADQASVAEGGTAAFTLTRDGETADPLTVGIRVKDPDNRLRGNHWDPPPTFPTQVEFAANETSQTLSLATPDDLRDLADGDVEVALRHSRDYLVGGSGLEPSASVTVTDNDTAQELELNFGKDGVNDADATEGDKVAIVVKRRSQDANQTAVFTVRLETDRSGADYRLADWTEDSNSGRFYKDFPLDLSGTDLEVKEELRITTNGETETNWGFWASIRPLQNANGADLSASAEAEYWTVKQGFRETSIDVTDTGATNGLVTIEADRSTVTEGEEVVFEIVRVDGPTSQSVTVRVQTSEANRQEGFGVNPSTLYHDVTLDPWQTIATIEVYPYVDGEVETTDILLADIESISGSRYTEGTPNQVEVEINDPPSGSTIVTVARDQNSIVEGQSGSFTFTRTGGDAASELTVNIRVDDPNDHLRGNHWDPAPVIPSQITFAANATTHTLTLTAPDDERDLPSAGLVTVRVLPGTGYLLGQSGHGTFDSISVSDTDTAQELTLEWGWVGYDESSWEAGEAWLLCPGTGDCTPGPAEGFFYYEDGRSFRHWDEIEERWPLHFMVSRRAQDIGKPVSFVVRVEHNRGWAGPRHSHWPIDPLTGNRYQEFPLTLTGNQRSVVGRIEVLHNGIDDPSDWEYSAEIIRIEAADGTALTDAEEAQYWTVNGSRSHTIDGPGETPLVQIRFTSIAPQPVPEGQSITLSVERVYGYLIEPFTVRVDTWEPNQQRPDGTNPTDRVYEVTFPAIPLTDRFLPFVASETQTQTLTIATGDDVDYEPRDTLKLRASWTIHGQDRRTPITEVRIQDDDLPTISLSADTTSITEGEPVTFTLTRTNNTAVESIVGVSVDDPGGFLDGNFASEAVTTPTNVVFAAGEAVKEIVLTPPDDWRDIPDSTLTFTVKPAREYQITGADSVTVDVADNDVAPQVQIVFNHPEVIEGNPLILIMQRIGEDKNPIEFTITGGPVGAQQYMAFGMGSGESLLHLTFDDDDDYKAPDRHYEFTLHPGRPEFWTPTGPTTVRGTILDDDPYTVGVRAITRVVDEGALLYYRIVHDGHTEAPLPVTVSHAEIGSAVPDGLLSPRTHTILTGNSGITRAYLTEANDGNEADAFFVVTLEPGDGYVIDPAQASATIAVRDRDPLPVLGFRDIAVEVGEADGTAEFWVDMVSPLPSLRTITVDYEITDGVPGASDDIVESTGTLTFAPGARSAVIEVPVVNDRLAELTEDFTVVLSNPVYATLQDGQASLTARGVITDDESEVTLEAQAQSVDEGSDVVLTLTRDGDPTDELTVWLDVDKTAPQALSRRDTVVFPAGSDTVDHTITTTDDDERAGPHTVTVTLVAPTSIGESKIYRRGSPATASVTVRDVNLGLVDLNTSQLRIAEGETIELELIRRSTGPALTVTLDVTETGQYASGSLPQTATFPKGSKDIIVTIPTEDDATAEDIGKLTVTVVDGTDYRAGWPNTHTFTIYDDDGFKPSVTVARDQNWVTEGDSVSFTVSRTNPTNTALEARLELTRVRYRVTQADLDDPTRGITSPRYHIHFGVEEITVEFPIGTNSVTITRPTTDDTLPHGNSTYHATVLNDADDDYIALSSSSAQIWVRDNDIPTVTGTSTTSDLYDGLDYKPQLPFSRTGDASGLLWLNYDFTQTRYRPAPLGNETYTDTETLGFGFQPGDAHGVSIRTLGYIHALGISGNMELRSHYCPNNPADCGYFPQYQVGTPSNVEFRYYSSFMGVRIDADQASVNEGDAATFTLRRQGGKPDAMSRPLEVRVNLTQEGDYLSSVTQQTITVAANEATATLTIPTTDDAVDEVDGSISVALHYELRADCTDDERCYGVGQYIGTAWESWRVTTAVTDNDYVQPGVSVADAEGREADGSITFTVSLDAPNLEQVATVDWATADDGSTKAATAGTDYTAASGSLTFAIGETEKTFTVTLLDDSMDEDHETFNVVLSNPSELVLGDDTASGTILDDELAMAVIFDTDAQGSVVEGQDIVLRIKRLPPLAAGAPLDADDPCYGDQSTQCFDFDGDPGNVALTVNVRVTQQGNVISGSAPTTVTFAPGSSYASLTIPIDDDATVEATGTVTAEVLNGAGYSPIFGALPQIPGHDMPTVRRTVHDNDLTFSVQDAQAGEAARQLDFTVSLNAAAPEEVTVQVMTVDGEATSHANVTATSLGQDFEAKSETLTFAVGEQQKTFTVAVTDDAIQEKSETLEVRLRSPPHHSSLADDTAVGTIIDDEQPMVASVSRAYAVVDEDHSGPVRFMVELKHPNTVASERRPAVGWQVVAGTATEGADYRAAGGVFNFPIGDTTGFLDVYLEDDNLFEPALETFTVELVQAGSRLLSISPTGASYEVSIRDDETLAATITADAETVAEGQDAQFTVTLTGGVAAEAVTVQFETKGDVSAPDDYSTPIGNLTFPPGNTTGSQGVLTIPAGEIKGTITFPIRADGTDDDDETMTVEISNGAAGSRAVTIASGDDRASTNILDQDSLTVSIQGTPSVAEGTAATFTVVLSVASDEDVSVDWSTTQAGDTLAGGETAEPDADYPAATGTVAIAAGSTSATFTVATTDDTLVEGNETFRVVLDEARITSTSPHEMVPLGVTAATGTIQDNDTAPTGVTVSANPRRLAEDDGATDITVTVSLDGTTQFTVDTPVTVEMVDRPGVNRNATLGVDYTATTSNTVIPAGQSSVVTTITLTPVDDNIAEDDEVARLSAKSSALAGTDGKGVVIEDNDVEPVEVVLSVDPDTVDESESSAALTVTGTLSGQATRVVDTVVTLSQSDGTAVAGDDYSTSTATLTIPAGEISATAVLVLTVLDDNIAEGSETLQVSGTTAGISVVPTDLTIQDNDAEPTSIGLSVTSAPIGEGGGAATVSVQATLLGAGTRSMDTLVTLTVVGLTATETDDYTATFDSSTLTIPAGQFSGTGTLTLTPNDDTLYEGDEFLAVRGTNATPGLPVNGVRLTIVDDDPAPTTVRLVIYQETLSEGAGVWLLDVQAVLEGKTTLTEDIEIETTLIREGSEVRSENVIQVIPLNIDAGKSVGETIYYLRDLNDDVHDGDETLELRGTTDTPGLHVISDQVIVTNDDTSGIRLSTPALTVREGRTQRYTVRLTSEPVDPVTVTLDVPPNAGFSVNPGTLTFTSQSWSRKFVTVTGLQDDDGVDEAAANITHTVSSTDERYRSHTVPDVLVTVRDNDTPGVTISETVLPLDEGTSGAYTVVLDTEPTANVTVTVVVPNGAELSLSSQSLTFTNSNWNIEQTVTVTASHDADVADEAPVTLTHAASGAAEYVSLALGSVDVKVTDDDEAGVTIAPAALDIPEGQSRTYTVVLDTQPTGDVTVTIGGAAGTDLSLNASTLTFTAVSWSAAQTVTVTAAPDGDTTDDPATLTHTVGSTADSDYANVAAESVAVTVEDVVGAGVTISETSLPIDEGDSATYTVVLDTRPFGDVTVTLGGLGGTDLSVGSSSLTFKPENWSTAQTVTVSAAQDADAVDDTATITHTVSSIADSDYDGLSAGSLGVTVNDDDDPGITVSESSLTVIEGASTTYTVVLDTQPIADVTVAVTAPGGSDVTADPTSLTFTDSNWANAQTVTVSAAHDADALDDPATITHATNSTDGDYSGISVADVDVTVIDDEDIPVTVSFGQASYSVAESDDPSTTNVTENDVTVTVTLSEDPEREVVITLFRVNQGGATSGDYSGVPASVTFQSGDTDQTFTFSAAPDTLDDDGESVRLSFGNLPNAVTAGTPAATTVAIADDDDPRVTVSFGQAGYTVAESDDPATTNMTENEVTVTVTLSADPERTVEIPISRTNQGGASNGDYEGVPARVTFASGDTTQTFTFTAKPDALDDDGESVELTFGNLPARVSAGAPAATTVSIADDDDPAVTVSFGAATYTVAESDDPLTLSVAENEVTVTVTLSADPERDGEVTLLKVNQGGASSADYSGVPPRVTFLSGDTEQTFTFTAEPDNADDDGESVKLTLASLPDRVSAGTHPSTTVSITDDDDPAVTVSFGNSAHAVAEGHDVTVTVLLSANPERTVEVPITVTNMDGATSADYSGVPPRLTFVSGDTTETFNFRAEQDTIDDDGERVRLTFGTLPTRVTSTSPSQVVVAITDDDDPAVTVSFGQASYSVAESDDPVTTNVTEHEVEVTVELSADPERTVEIPLTVTPQDGATSSDYSGVPPRLTFNAGDTTKTFTFRATPDTIDDDGEWVRLTFGTLPPRVTAASPSQAVVTIADDDDPAVTVRFGQTSYSATEGSTVTVTVRLSADPERTVEIPITTTNQGGATNADYEGVPPTVTFVSGDTEESFTFTAKQDAVDDDDERVRLGFGNLPARVSAGSPSQTTVAITDDDVPAVTVSFGQASYSVAESDDSATPNLTENEVEVTVTLSADPEREVEITLFRVNQGGASSGDYSGVPTALTFESGDTEQTFTFSAAHDTLDDDGESVRLSFGGLPNAVTAGTHAATTVSITDDDDPAVTVRFGQSTYPVTEGDDVTVTVRLSADPERTVEIPLTTTNQGGASSGDYSGVPPRVTFVSGDTTETFTFSALHDTVDDDGESVRLAFGNLPARVSPGSPAATTVAIADDDVPSVTVGFASDSYTVAESDDPDTVNVTENEAVISVTLSADPERTVVVPLTVTNQGGATGADYSGVPANVTFTSGQTQQTFRFSATDDAVDDDGECVKLAIGAALPAAVSVGATDATTVAITDDDDPEVSVRFGAPGYTVAEGESVDITITLSADPERTVEIPLTTTEQGGATGADYSNVPATVTFNSGDTELTFALDATQDAVDDDGESVKVGFGSMLPAGVTVDTSIPSGDTQARDTTTVAITDDDGAGVTVTPTALPIAEGHSEAYTVVLDSQPTAAVTIAVNAPSGSDVSVDETSLTFTASTWSQAQTVTVSAAQDADAVDDTESITHAAASSDGDYDGISVSPVRVTVRDDEDVPVTVGFEQPTYAVTEGNDVTVTVTLSADPERTVEIPLTATNQGGATSADYGGVPATVTFASGDTEQTFTFTAKQDTVDDDGESVKLAIGATLPTAVSVGATAATTVSITDDDVPAVTVSFGQAAYPVAEGNDVTVTVTLSADPERTVAIPLATTHLGGASNVDYSGVPAEVTFTSGETEQTFRFSATDDTVDDDGESVRLTFGALQARVSEGGTDETVVRIADDDDPAVSVSFGAATYTVAEGDDVMVPVTLSADPERTVAITVLRLNQGGSGTEDYSGVPTSLTFASGQTAQTITFSATADNVDDDGESVKLTLGNLPSRVSAGAHLSTTVAITDDDVPAVNVSFGQPTYSAPEGGHVTVKVKLSADPERTVEIPLTTTEQGGATSADYVGGLTTVTFSAGDTEKEFNFSAVQDAVDDDGESVKLGFGNLPTRVSAGAPATTTVTIADDDDPAVTVSFGQASYSVAESDDPGTTNATEHEVEVTVTLSANPEREVVIPLTTTNQGGASTNDYSGVPANVTFTDGDTTKSFTFRATADAVDDDGESVKLGFGGTLPAGVSVGTPATTTVSIADDDHPAVTVSFGQASFSATEGGTATVTVKLSADPERRVEVPITLTNMDGATSADYSGVPPQVTFVSGDTTETFEFRAEQDAIDDDGERVRLTFGTLPPRVSSASPSQAVVAITDDDDPAVTVSFAQASYSVAESDDPSTTNATEHEVEVTVTLSANPERLVVIPLTTTHQGGASSSDYSGVPANLTFTSGVTAKSFAFRATPDAVDDDGESVKLGFGGGLPAGVSVGAPATSTVSINDDDDPAVTVSFGQSGYSVAESDDPSTTNVTENEVVVTVKLSADPERTVEIPLTTTHQGGASNGDYSGVPTEVTFTSGETEQTFTFRAEGDSADDDGESVKLGFGASLPTGVSAGAPATTTVSIADDDDPAATVSFGQAAYPVAEGDDVTVTVRLSADPERTVEVPITVTNMDGATAADYSGVPARVTFVSGDTTETFSFRAEQDAIDDDGERVKLTFGTLPDRVSSTSPSQAVVSIADDDDPAVTVSFGRTSYSVAESDDPSTTTLAEHEVEVTVALSADPERTVEIPLTATAQDGATSSDYSGVPPRLTFNAGDTTRSFTFRATADTVDDDGEWVRLTFGTLPPGVTAVSPSQAVVTITDDDDPEVTVSFGQSSYSVAESDDTSTTNVTENEVEVTVTLSADPERTVEIPLTTTNLGGASNGDYSGVPAKVTFTSGETEQTFTFSATSDSVDDDGESVRLGFGASLPARVTAGTPDTATVSITDDDDPAVTVSFGQATYTVAEGTDETVALRLSADPERTVEVPLLKANQGGATSADYSGVPATVTFHSGDTEVTFKFSAASDSANDDGESVKLSFGSLPTRVSAGTPASTTVTITDDDVPTVTVSFGQASYGVAESDDTSTTSVTENEVVVTVTLSADPERTVEIPITTTNQDGASSADYEGVPARLTFASGDTLETFTFRAKPDSIDDDGESVKLGFGGSLPLGVSEGATDEAVVSIADDDDPAVSVSFGASTYTVDEYDDPSTTNVAENEVVVTVELSADPEREVVIPLTRTNQNGATDSDYTGVPTNVTFVSGDTRQTFTFMAVDDSDDDDGESVELGFGGSLPTGVSAGASATTTVTISDDDRVPITDPNERPGFTKEIPYAEGSVLVRFDAERYSATEGGLDAIVTVRLDSSREEPVEITLTAEGHAGATPDDWTGVPPVLTFGAWEIQKSFTLVAVDDTIEDDGEMVRLGFGNLPEGYVAAHPSTADVTLMNDDADQPATCDSGIWCAVLKLADSSNDDFGRLHLGYHGTQDPYADRSSISSDHFTFRGETFKVWSVHTWPNIDPSLDPRPAYGIPERSRFSIHIRRVDGPSWAAEVKRDHWEDWTLHIGDVAVRFTEVDGHNGNTFVWLSEAFYLLFMDWMPSTTHQIWIEETPLEDLPDPAVTVPSEPRYLRVVPFDNQLVATWRDPVSDGNSPITGYRLQWKPDAESWSNANAVSEAMVDEWPPGTAEMHRIIGELTDGSTYTVRVMAVNAVGDSAPSNEHFGMSQSAGPQLTSNTVNGAELTLTFDRNLDETSVPDVSRFAVIVNGGLRDVIFVSISGRSVTLLLSSPVSAADEVEMRYLMPASADEPAIRDTDGNYAASCDFSEPGSESENLTEPAGLQPLTAQFEQMPETHSGPDDELRFHIRFSEPVRIDAGPAFAFLLTVSGGDVTSAWWVNRDARLWEVVLAPDSQDDITITLPADRACDARGAPCASGDRRLTNSLEHTITGDGAPSEGRSVNSNRQGQGTDGKSKSTTGQSKSTTNAGKSVEPSVGKSVDPPASPPQAPQNLGATANSDGSVTLTWDAPDDASVSGYRILRRRPTEGEDALQVYVEDTGSTDTTYTDTETTSDVRHVYRVKAIGKSGVSEASNRTEVTPTLPPTNAPATGTPTISGTPQVGETLGVDTSSLADADGLANATFNYMWIRNDAGIDGAAGATYGLADADAGATIKVRVTFSDDAGHAESLTSAPTAEVAARPNRTATGAPTIGGTPEVGQTLTADASGIADADGLANATFNYKWIRNDAEIDRATGASYELVDADAGATIKVRVTFTDDAGHAESLSSAATGEVAARPNRLATGAPTISGTPEVGQTLTADTSGIA
ncbi:MAG: fibronectin type III domain-containing protein, partial [Chloroflexi bacterium]|nr:fibronectin type III domain-containing protein [Chloroflexota bacterium]